MAYVINKSQSGNITIPDGQAEATSTSLTLLGKNFAGYGGIVATNFVHMLENFSNTTAPAHPINGQLWYDNNTSQKTLKVYDAPNGVWKKLAGISVGASEPGNAVTGDLWWNTALSQLKGYTGSSWILIGPANTGFGISGQVVVEIPDNLASTHVVIKEYIYDVLIAVYSKDAAFTHGGTGDAADMVSGFSVIKPGVNLATNIANIQFNGNANNALQLNNLSSTDFLRANIPSLTTSTLTVKTDTGFYVGDGSDLVLNVSNGKDVGITNQTTNGNITISVSGTGQAMLPAAYSISDTYSLTTKQYVDNAVLTANASVNALTLFRTGANNIEGNIAPAVGNTNVFTFGTSTARFNNMYSTTFTGNLSGNVSGTTATLTGNISAGNANITGLVTTNTLTVTSNTTTGNVVPSLNNVYDLGSASNKYRTLYCGNITGTAYQAQYADLAEVYSADAEYEAGTVLIIGGEQEVTQSTIACDTKVIGIVSSAPAYIMNSEATGVKVALLGRVPCKVTGRITKGDRLVTSDIAGHAMAIGLGDLASGCIVGKALQDFNGNSGTIEVFVDRM